MLYHLHNDQGKPLVRYLPRRASFIMAALPLIMVASAAPAHAAGILDSTTNAFKSLENTWFSALIGDAKDLFTVLAGLEITWLALTWLLARQTFDEIVPALVKKIITLGFFAAILINAQTWVPDILNSFTQAGATASGLPSLSPSTIAGYALTYPLHILAGQATQSGTGFFGKAIQAVKDTVDPAMWLEMIERVMIAIMLFFAFIYIAIEMMVLLIESYIVVGAGVLFLGFGGSRWTTKFVDGYINFAVSVGVKLFTIYLIVGALITTVIPQINSQLMTTGAFNFSGGLTAAAIMLVAAMITKKIPEHAGALLGSGAGMTAGAFTGEAGKVGGAVLMAGAAAATGGASLAAGGAAAGAAGGAGAAGAAGSVGAAGAGGVAASSGAAGVPMAGGVSGGAAGSSGSGVAGVPLPSSGNATGSGGGPSTADIAGTQQDARTTSGNSSSTPAAPQGKGSSDGSASARLRAAATGMKTMSGAASSFGSGLSQTRVGGNHISTSH